MHEVNLNRLLEPLLAIKHACLRATWWQLLGKINIPVPYILVDVGAIQRKNCCTGEWKAQWCGHSGGTGYRFGYEGRGGSGRFSSEGWRRLCCGAYRQDKAAYLWPQSITPSTLAMSAVLLMSAREAGAFGPPPSLTSNEQSQRDSGRGRRGLTQAAKHIRRGVKQSEESKTEDVQPKLASISQVVLILGHQMSSFKSKTFSQTAPRIRKSPRTHLCSKIIVLNNIIIIIIVLVVERHTCKEKFFLLEFHLFLVKPGQNKCHSWLWHNQRIDLKHWVQRLQSS